MTERTVILAGEWGAAAEIAKRLGLTLDEWISPTSIGQISGMAEAPVYFDYSTFETNPAREALRDWFAWKITPPEQRPPSHTQKEIMSLVPPARKSPIKKKTRQAETRPWFKGVALGVGLDYLNQTNGNVIAIDADGDKWTPDPVTGCWECADISDAIAPEFGPFDVFAA